MSAKKGGIHPFKSIAGSVHIKKNTAGTSNEISLSVLDGLKSQADSKLGEADPKVKLGDLSLFTVAPKKERRLSAKEDLAVPASSGKKQPKAKVSKGKPPKAKDSSVKPSGKKKGFSGVKKEARVQRNRERALLDPEKEIKRRKKNRRRRRIVLSAVGSVALCACIAAGAMFAWNAYEKHQSGLSLLSQAFDELEKADSLVLSMDDMVTMGDAAVTTEEIDDMGRSIKDAGIHLSAACAFADEASSSITDSSGDAIVDRVVASAQARRDMLSYAENLLRADGAAKEGVDGAQASWDLVVQADALMKEAADLVVDTTEENVRASQAKSEEAIVLLDQAAETIAFVQAQYPSADFSALSALIEKKREQNGYAIESDKAIYIQDKATAESFNDLYNQADAEAIALVADLPEKPAQPILDMLDEQTEGDRTSYLDARKRAAESDAFIRDYLGQSGR